MTDKLLTLGTGICSNCEHEGCSCERGTYRIGKVLYNCKRLLDLQEEALRESKFLSCGLISKRNYEVCDYRGEKSFDSVEELKKLAENPDRYLGENYYVYGPNGTQKTTICKAIGRDILRGIKVSFDTDYVRYTSMTELLNLLIAEDELDSSRKDTPEYYQKMYDLEKIRKCNVLFVDESFDRTKCKVSKTNLFSIALLDTFLRKRLEGLGMTTIFISNVSPNDIDPDIFGNSFIDLVDRECNYKLPFFDRYDEITRRRRKTL